MSLYGVPQLTASFRTVRVNTNRVAEDIPETGYSYRPSPASRSVAETLVHIAWLASADRLTCEPITSAAFNFSSASMFCPSHGITGARS